MPLTQEPRVHNAAAVDDDDVAGNIRAALRRPRSHPTRTGAASAQGLTLVHLPAQRKRFLWNKGCLWGV